MFRDNPLKRRLASGGRALGCWLSMVSPVAAEIVGLAGYDCVMMDHEHGPGALFDALGLMQAVQASGASPLMRVPWNDPVYVKRALDLGVEGVMFPQINTADEARAAVAATRYPPAGVRGAAYGSVRASDYGLVGERYRDRAADTVLVICQIETREGVAAIPEMARVPGVDVLFIGPYDLSASIGKLGRFEDTDVRDLIESAERAILESGVCYGTIPHPLRSVAQLVAGGCRLVISGSDVSFVRKGAVAEVQAFRGLVGQG